MFYGKAWGGQNPVTSLLTKYPAGPSDTKIFGICWAIPSEHHDLSIFGIPQIKDCLKTWRVWSVGVAFMFYVCYVQYCCPYTYVEWPYKKSLATILYINTAGTGEGEEVL